MDSDAKTFAVIAAVILLTGAGVYWEISLWNECRSDHSFFYCMLVLGK
jgi:uncharacterized membrane protein YiaA